MHLCSSSTHTALTHSINTAAVKHFDVNAFFDNN